MPNSVLRSDPKWIAKNSIAQNNNNNKEIFFISKKDLRALGNNLNLLVSDKIENEEGLLQNVAENHRAIVRSLRFGSPLQSAYLSGVLVLLSLAATE